MDLSSGIVLKNKPSVVNPNCSAVIVIHGIGEQAPFEMLGAFATNLVKCLGDVRLSTSLNYSLSKKRDDPSKNIKRETLEMRTD
jgi:hypothetical protein